MKALVWFGAPLLALTVVAAAGYAAISDRSVVAEPAEGVRSGVLTSTTSSPDACCASEAPPVAACPVSGATQVARGDVGGATACPRDPNADLEVKVDSCAHTEQTVAQDGGQSAEHVVADSR